jgi:hypothetical protein
MEAAERGALHAAPPRAAAPAQGAEADARAGAQPQRSPTGGMPPPAARTGGSATPAARPGFGGRGRRRTQSERQQVSPAWSCPLVCWPACCV